MNIIQPMHYVEVTRIGGPEVLQISTRHLPELKSGEVLIKVHAAGINRADLGQRSGKYPVKDASMPLLGLEVSGEVVQTAVDVYTLKPGEHVCALVNGGGYAEYVAAPAVHCLPIPKGVSMLEAACIPEVSMTVWSNIFFKSPPQKGQFFLVHGGTSGIGTFAIQLGKALGIRVLTTVGGKEKCQTALELGAELVIDYRKEDFEEIITKHTHGQGVHAVLDMVGGDYTPKNIRLLAMDGHIAQIAAMRGIEVNLNLFELMLKRGSISGSLLKMRSSQEKAAIIKDLVQNVWPLYEQKEIKTIVQQAFPMAEAAAAHKAMAQGGHIGKFVLTMV